MTPFTWLASWFTDVTEEGRQFDATWGTHTCDFDFGNYEPTLPSVIDAALDALDVGPEGVTLLDVGSGKGRVVMVASQRPWLRVVGIEARPALHRRAERNLAAFEARGGRACPVALFCGDVRSHPLPNGPLVVFLYNSLPGRPLRAFLPRLAGRAIRLVYVNPQHADEVDAAGFRGLTRVDDPQDSAWSWRIYRPG